MRLYTYTVSGQAAPVPQLPLVLYNMFIVLMLRLLFVLISLATCSAMLGLCNATRLEAVEVQEAEHASATGGLVAGMR